MKRSVTDVIRRGFENTVANWPLLLIRIAEGIAFVILVVVAVVAAIIPVAVSIGVTDIDLKTVDDPAELMWTLLASYWSVILFLFALVTVILVVLVAIHSFVEAGCARVYVDAERVAGPASSREAFRVFSADRWLAGGRRDWWPVFWIYNIAWGVAGLLLLAPMVALLALIAVLRENPAVAAGVGCLGLAVSVLFFIAVAVVTNIWCQKAIVLCVDRVHGARDSLGEAWREFKLDAGRHIGVALILWVLMIVGSMMFATLGAGSSFYDTPGFSLAVMPMQLVSSFINTIFSAVMTSWFLASFAALGVEEK